MRRPAQVPPPLPPNSTSNPRTTSPGALHGIGVAHREWSAAQDDLRSKLFGQMAQCLRDHDAAPSSVPEDWMEDDEIIEAEMVLMLAAGGAERRLVKREGEKGGIINRLGDGCVPFPPCPPRPRRQHKPGDACLSDREARRTRLETPGQAGRPGRGGCALCPPRPGACQMAAVKGRH